MALRFDLIVRACIHNRHVRAPSDGSSLGYGIIIIGAAANFAATRVNNLSSRRGAVADTLQRFDRVRCLAAITARSEGVGMGADDRDLLQLSLVQRQEVISDRKSALQGK